ncbi:pyrimidine utilization transport protein G [Bradyrhizobium sp. U87765 SZCCT0131]|uniref:solute carrier family 23 protein n=1 Tax=unclassified Bradyrhizobium TaxID=2631580 RepID=UPI001BA558AB|nr:MULTISPECIES: solute carrier family 23 protein [unclassified Bradyrhizobium]MBR1221647.1 pyrimidine utilization transport protein G [Bradyrhizobium sp. U87765 SZCCT0131]MBR1264430.1 pyrimidine utilization transport protein G [Bradyrhizobium sp. U87765 SZCCT0134]MBR1304663.1 pyrimidine utilization transport protein G [Bradyrhizobium sp. U87765 SZCCT0110]MBR1322480.1 pyrimidine utilization transport protein G [Bradyrhizobium sp. U87765 SZCCT0109]MBR1346592.1 pyrimidine utilization transport p
MDTNRRGTWLPTWSLKEDGVIAPDERLPWGQTIVVGVQHVGAMFGATALAPIIMGFDPNVAIFFSGIGTLIFFLMVGGRVPSYLGSSFSFIAVVIAATAYTGSGPNPNIADALGGIIAAGLLYAVIGVVVILAGTRWIGLLMPPVITGAVVAVIGLNLAGLAVKSISATGFDTVVGLVTIVTVGLIAVYAEGLVRRLPILLGGVAGYVAYFVGANMFGLAKPISFAAIESAAWFGLPNFVSPTFTTHAIGLIAPVALILAAENLGHIKAIGIMTGRNLDADIGRAFLGDAIATVVSASGGGTGVTTYAENMGVMAVNRIYSTLVFVVAGVFAILLGMSPKFGAVILTIPGPVIGGLSVVVYGMIAATAGRIWVENNVDFSDARNLITVAVVLTAGAGDLTLHLAGFTLGGIGSATFGAIILYYLLGRKERSGDLGGMKAKAQSIGVGDF